MKGKFRAFVSLLVVLSCLVGLIPAQSIGSLGFSAKAEPIRPVGDQLESDGWIYRLCSDGDIELIGYTDPLVAELSLPKRLKGAWVTRLSEDAFAENTKLKSVEIPAQIGSIPSTSFPNAKGLTISAYNGTAALSLARHRGFAVKNRSEYDFFDEILDLSEIKSSQWSHSGSTLVVDAPYDRLIDNGVKLYLPPSSGIIKGAAVVVTDCKHATGSVTARVQDLVFTDAVRSFKVEDERMNVDSENIRILDDCFALVQDDSDSRASRGVTSFVAGVSQKFVFSIPLNVIKISGEVTVTPKISVSANYTFPSLNSVTVKNDTTFDWEIDIKGEYESKTWPGMKKNFATIPLYSAGVVTAYLDLAIVVNVHGQVSFTGNVRASSTIRVDSAGSHVSSDPIQKTFQCTASVSGSTAVSGSLNIRIGFSSIAGIKMGLKIVELELRATIELKGETCPKWAENQPLCKDVSVDLNFNISGRIGAIDLVEHSDEIKNASSDKDTIQLYREAVFYDKTVNALKRHWEGKTGKWTEKCLKGTFFNVMLVYGYDDKVETIEVDKDSTIAQPSMEERTGLVFKGWYTTSLFTNQWDFARKVTQDITLYAKWDPAPTPTITPAPTVTIAPDATPDPSLTFDPSAYGKIPERISKDNSGNMIEYVQDNVIYWLTGDYVTENSEARVIGYIGSPESVVIPEKIPYERVYTSDYSEIYDLSVTEICKSAFANCESLQSVVIPSSASEIDDYAFFGCKNLLQVQKAGIGKCDIGECAFCGCVNLIDAYSLIYNARYMEEYCFADCKSLKAITLRSDPWQGAFSGCTALQNIELTNETTDIGGCSFEGCTSLTKVTIPGSVTEIGGGCFSDCTSLKTVNFANGIRNLSIGGAAFSGCTSLVRIDLPGRTRTMAGNVFCDCSSLKYIGIPDHVQIRGRAPINFSGCASLESIKIPAIYFDDIYGVWSGPFDFRGCNSLQSIYLGDGVEKIPNTSFCDLPNLTTVRFPNGIKEIERNAFSNCPKLQSVSINSNDLSIWGGAFSDCKELKSVNITGSIETLGGGAFEGCSALESVILPERVGEIHNAVFHNCTSLKTITLPAGLKIVDSSLFEGCANLEKVILPHTLEEIGVSAFSGCVKLKEILIPQSVNKIGMNAFKDCESLKEIHIPNAVKNISMWMFYNCKSLESVTLPKTVESYGGHVFYGCESLKELTLPTGLKKIDYYIVPNLEGLIHIDIPETVEEISLSAFSGCGNLKSLKFPDAVKKFDTDLYNCSSLEEVVLPRNLTEIPDCLFFGCDRLTSLRIYDEVKVIPEDFILRSDRSRPGPEMYFYVEKDNGHVANTLRKMYPKSHIIADDAPNCTVRFDPMGGLFKTVKLQVKKGLSMDEPKETPYRGPDYTFIGWYKDPYCLEEWDFSAPVEGNMTLYAGWYDKNNTFPYTLDRNGDAVIIGYNGKKTNLEIPANLGDCKVVGIAANAIPDFVHMITLPSTLKMISSQAFMRASNLSSIDVNKKNTVFSSESGVLYEGTKLVAMPRRYAASSYSVPGSTTEIGDYAFNGCEALRSVHFSADVNKIGSGNFIGMNRSFEITGPVGASVLKGYAEANFIDYNAHSLFFVDNDKTLSMARVSTGDTVSLPKLNDSNFIGWSAEKDSDTLWTDTKMPDNDLILYAVRKSNYSYEKTSSGIVLKTFNGRTASRAGEEETVILVPSTIDGEQVTSISPDCFPDKTVTLQGEKGSIVETFAAEQGMKFKPIIHTVHFDCKGGSEVADIQAAATEDIILPKSTRTGYIFKGWSESETSPDWSFWAKSFTMKTEDITLYAKWVETDEILDLAFTFRDIEGGLAITGCQGDMPSMEIPAEISGVPVIAIDEEAFLGKTNLRELTVPASVATVGDRAFKDSSVTSVTFSGVVNIGESAFENCSSLNSVTLSTGLRTIGNYAFADCTALYAVTLPSGVKQIGRGAFQNCEWLGKVSLPASLEGIPSEAFSGCAQLQTLTLGKSIAEFAEDAVDGCSSLNSITVNSDNPYFSAVDGVLFNKSGTTLICYPEGKSGTKYIVPDQVAILAAGSMKGNRLTELVLGKGVTAIGDRAISGAYSLSEVSLNSSLQTIGIEAFGGCIALETITIPASVVKIDANAFRMTGLKEINISGNPEILGNAIPDNDDITIYSNRGSNAEAYATEHGIRFVDRSKDVPVTGVTLTSSLTLQVGDRKKLSYTLKPSNTTEGGVTWRSIDDTVAGVDENGYVQAYTEGETTVVIIAQNGSRAECKVVVQRGKTDLKITDADFVLPGGMTRIEEEAFSNTTMSFVVIPAKCSYIGPKAFSDCKQLQVLWFVKGDVTIPDDIISGCGVVGIVAPYGSKAAAWAINRDIYFGAP